MADSGIPPPTRFGVILYPQFEVLDVFGPLEALNTISRTQFSAPPPNEKTSLAIPLSLSIIASSMNPVPSMVYDYPRPQFQQTFNPTHTFETAPEDLEVLLVPGGLGNGGDDAMEFIKARFPSLRYLFTVCTGANLAARAGVLRGCKATTNKKAWGYITSKDYSAWTYWIADARWVVSGPETPEGVGKVWTTSGVSAGTDGMIAFISAMYGENIAQIACDWMEYTRNKNDDGYFAKVWDCKDVPNKHSV